MSSAVLVIITIPNRDHENDIKEKAKLCDSLKKPKNGINKNELHTINEAPNENHNNEYKAKVDNLKELPIENVVEDALSYLGIIEAAWSKSRNGNYHQISFSVDLEDSDAVIQYFKSRGIGSKVGSNIGIIPFTHFCYDDDCDELYDMELTTNDEGNGKQNVSRTLSNFKAAQNNFLKSVTARLTVAQVVDNVKSGASLTFDFVCYLIFASWIAAMGLLDNSVISLVASMLVSPMMGPVMAMTFGTIIKDGSLRAIGFKNLGVCFAITILFGYFFGMIALNFTDHWADQAWPTNMMRERGLPRVAWVGTLVAFPSGCAVAISLLSGNEASLVGVAISVSLLPPAVNTGLLWAFATLRTLYSIGQDPIETHYSNNISYYLQPALTPSQDYTPFYNDNLAIETALLGCLSLVLSLINITNIFIGALILLKIKEIAPLSSMSPTNRRFFQEDIRIVRQYNEEHGSDDANMGEVLLKEWADIAGLDANHLLSDKPEARVTQLQTLTDIVRDVEADQVYKSITRNRLSISDNLVRRLSQGMYQPTLNNSNMALNTDGRRRSSIRSINLPNIRVSDVESGAIANRRRSNRRSSRLSQTTPNFIPMEVRRDISVEEYDNFSMRDPSRPSTPPVKIPHSAGVQSSTVFNFGDNQVVNDMNRPIAASERQRRRRSSALLRRSLQTSEHSPYSVWPSARISPANTPRFVVTPVTENYNDRYCIPEISIEERE